MSHTLSATLELRGIEGFEIVAVRLSEGLSRRTSAEVVIATSEDLELEKAVGRDAVLTLRGGDARHFHLRLGAALFAEHRDSAFRWELHLHDPLWPLGLGLSTRKFRDQSARAIVDAILGEHRVAHRWELRQDPPDLPYTVQYRESNLAFVERLLEFEGIHYAFTDDGTLVLDDWTPGAELVHGGEVFEFVEAAGALQRGQHGIHEVRRGVRVTTGRVTLGDYNWKRPDVPLRETAWGDADVELERYEWPAGFRKPDRGAALAKLRVEAHRAEAHYLVGQGDVLAFAPGKAFEMGSLAGDAFAGKYLLVALEHEWHAGAFSEGARGPSGHTSYEHRFTAIPLELPFRPPVKTPRPTVAGTHTAVVRGPAGSEIHTDEHGRFRAQFHWDREATGTDEDSRWLRLMQETSSSMVLARTGWEVMVGYVDGDPGRPLGLGRAINGAMPPTFDLPGGKNRMAIRTPSSPATGGYSEIRMDDSAGGQHIAVRAEKDLEVVVKNDKTEKVGQNETHTVGADFKREVLGDQSVSIDKSQRVTLGSTAERKVAKSRDISVGGSESVDVGGGARVTVGGSDTEKVGGVRTSIVGSIRVPDFKALAQSAVQGLVPGPAATILSMSKGSAFKGLLGTAGAAAANAAGASLVNQGDASGVAAAVTGSLAASANGALGTSKGASGFPTLGDLGAQFTALTSKENVVTKIKGAVSTATGGLSDLVWKDEKDGKREAPKFGLDQVDLLVGLFAQGGIGRAATKKLTKLVGGAYVQTALGPIDWGSAGAHSETVGGVKLTTTPKDVGQTVTGSMVVTVLGQILRDTKLALTITAKQSAIRVGAVAQYLAGDTLAISGKGGVTIDAGQKVLVKGGEKSSIEAKPSSVVVKTPKIGLESATKIVINGKKLALTKEG